MLPRGAGGVRCMDCGAMACADGYGTPITLRHLPECPVRAEVVLADMANQTVQDKVANARADGSGSWRPDPYVPGVWGFFVDEKVRVIVYNHGDFEADDEWVNS